MLTPLLSILLSVVVAGVVSFRLLRLARRTHELPELLVGIGLGAYVLAQVASSLSVALHQTMNPGVGVALFGIALMGYTAVQGAIAFFTVETFGRTLWRWGLFALVMCIGVATRLAMLVHGATSDTAAADHPFLSTAAAVSLMLVFGWAGIEAIVYHAKAQRAMKLGLAGPLVVNRLLVWGLGGMATALLILAIAVANAAGQGSTTHGVNLALITAAGLVNAVTWTLTFTPPEAYRAFVGRRGAGRESTLGG